MRLTSVRIAGGLLLLCFVLGTSSPSTIDEAVALFDKNLFQEALTAYQAVYGSTDDDDIREKAFFRASECFIKLDRFGEGLEFLLGREEPQVPHRRARHLIVKAGMLGRFRDAYRYIMRDDIVEEEDREVFRLTPAEIDDLAGECYEGLWTMRSDLIRMKTSEVTDLVFLHGGDPGLYPTLFDYLISVWVDFLLSGRSEESAPGEIQVSARLLLVEDFEREVNLSDPRQLLAAELLEEAWRFEPAGRVEAGELRKISRLLLPLDHANLFDFRSIAGDTAEYEVEDLAAYKDRLKEILLGWMDTFEAAEAAAEAGYQAAKILHDEGKMVEAVELCVAIEDQYHGTRSAVCARDLRMRIEAPSLDLDAMTVMPPGKGAFKVTTRNITDVHFRLYRLDPDKLRDDHEAYLGKRRYGENKGPADWSSVMRPNWLRDDWGEAWLDRYLDWIEPGEAWDIQTGDTGRYETLTAAVDPPALVPGIYLAVACSDDGFKRGRALLSACFLNVTRLVLVGSAGPTSQVEEAFFAFAEGGKRNKINDPIFRLYAFDAETGEPARGVDINATLDRWEDYRRVTKIVNLDTDVKGAASLSLPVHLVETQSNFFQLDPLARLARSYAYWSNGLSFHYRHPRVITVFMEIDRPIYQPGDEVKTKVVVVRWMSGGFRTVDEGTEVAITAYDTNRNKFFSRTVNLNSFGSASVTFEIPGGRLLGRYTLRASCRQGRFEGNGDIGFSVEEYKRPEFEIALESAEGPWKYHQAVTVKGMAAYYFGGPVPEAPVTYRVKRQRWLPYRYRFWFRDEDSGGTDEIATGETVTGPDGSFTISFTPTPPAGNYPGRIPDISRFIVEVEARDSGGRTIEAKRSYRAGSRALYLVLKPAKGFFLESDSAEVTSRLFGINDVPQAGTGSYKVFLLGDGPVEEPDREGMESMPYWARRFSPAQCHNPPLEVQLEAIPSVEMVATGTLDHDADGEATIRIDPLPRGTYRIVETTQDEWGEPVSQERIVVVVGGPESAVPIPALSVMLFEKDEYETGEVARCIIGSAAGSGIYHVEVWAGNYLVSHTLIRGERPVRMFELPITEDLKGGFTLRWFGVCNLEILCGQVTVAVPWVEKKLEVALDPFDPELEPGREYAWGVTVTDWKGAPAQAEVLALMYDRSLEYYTERESRWLNALYELRSMWGYLPGSVFDPYVVSFPMEPEVRMPGCPDRPGPPVLRIDRWGRIMRLYETFGTVTSAMEVSLRSVSLDAVHVRGGRAGDVAEYVDGDVEMPGGGEFEFEEKAAAIEARAEFADAAFFEPHLATARDGRAEFTFKAPEQLTAWRVKLFVLTPDVKEGSLVRDVVTRKDLVIRADIPRFLRERDEGTVTAIVHNESDAHLAGEVFIDVTEGGENINECLGLAGNKQRFQLEPHTLATFDWSVEIPPGVSIYKIRVAAVSRDLSDAEERELPILPSRQRLIESTFAVLTGSESKDLGFKIKDDSTRRNELMLLQIEPQLALSILNTIPFLAEYPYGCVEQILNRYVPLSIVSEIYEDYPEIREAVGKIPKRKTPTPSWEKDDPRRLMSLMETPWVWQSKGRPTGRPLIDLLDPDVVETQREMNLKRLREAQLPNGAFPWWPGGKADPYMTLYVLAGFAEAKRYGVEIPADMMGRALGYLNKEISEKGTRWSDHLSLIAYAAYVITAYSPEEVPEVAASYKLVRRWLEILDKIVGELRPLAKAYVAYAHYRLGNETRAQEVLDMALDGAREDPITGVYWTPEKYSWVWYSDTVEKHAFFLRALQDLRPEDERLPGLVKWLLFNRKGNVWKSTKASAAAVYALLDHMRLAGVLSGDEVFKARWAGKTYSAVVEADEWLDEPLRWEERGFDIGEDATRATIEKEGPGTAFASLTWIYSTDQLPEASGPGLLNLERKFYRRVRKDDGYHLKPIESGGEVAVGDEIEVQLKISSRSRFEYMHLKDLKASGFEAEELLSGWRRDPISFYEEPRHSLTNFFFGWIPHGEYILRYRLRPTKPGVYRIGAATLQSMYAPEMTAHSAGFVITVRD